MLASQFNTAVAAVRTTAQLDHVARQLWAAHGQGAIDDAAAQALATAVQARRAAFSRPPGSVAIASGAPAAARRRPPRSPDRQRSLERRRRQAASGAMPPQIAARFTLAEQAVLAVIGRQCQRAGACCLPLDAIAAVAGVSRSTAKNAIREAQRLGLLERRERRHRGAKSDTNVLTVISREWRAWLARGSQGSGGKTPPATVNKGLNPRSDSSTAQGNAKKGPTAEGEREGRDRRPDSRPVRT